jgi:hypothetical protein
MARSSAFSASFDETSFRYAIRETMLMGMPETVADRLMWVWERDRTYIPDDPTGDPYDWSSPAATDVAGNATLTDPGTPLPQTLVVPYAFEFAARTASTAGTVFGEIDTSRMVVTLLDTDYDQINTADYAMYAGTKYRIRFEAPPQGLFGVTVWTVHLEAEDSA